MNAPSHTSEPAVAAFVWRTLSPSITVLLDFASTQHDTMDPESLHDFRVALRRLRSDLRSMRPFLSADGARSLREGLAELDALVRPVRDGDVMIERLTVAAAQTPNPIDAEIVEALHHELSVTTDRARDLLLERLEAGAYDALFGELSALRDSDLVQSDSDTDLTAILERRNKQLWRQVRKAANALGRDADDAELHQLRVLVKRSRFLAEASVPELGRWAARRARAAARIQTILGQHQDSVVFSQRLLAMPRPTAAHTLAVDALLAVESDARRRLRRRWHRLWRRIDRRAR